MKKGSVKSHVIVNKLQSRIYTHGHCQHFLCALGSLGCSLVDIITFQKTNYECLREDGLWTQMKFYSVVKCLNNANVFVIQRHTCILLWCFFFFFCLGTDDYEPLRAWHSASIAAKAITCCDRDKEASSPCRKLIDWAVKKREMPFTMGSEGQRAWDTFILYFLLC